MSFQPGAVLNTQSFGNRPENVEVPHYESRDPSSSDTGGGFFPVGKIWINTSTGAFWGLGLITSFRGITLASWSLLGSAVGDLNTLSDGSTIVSPTAGNIAIVGTPGQISVTGSNSPGTLTLSLPPTFYQDWQAWTPTISGSATSGTTTYVAQMGLWSRVGDIIFAQFFLNYSAATGTGNLVLGNLPIPIGIIFDYFPSGYGYTSGITFPAGSTSIAYQGVSGSTTAFISAYGSGINATPVVLANSPGIVSGTIIYSSD